MDIMPSPNYPRTGRESPADLCGTAGDGLGYPLLCCSAEPLAVSWSLVDLAGDQIHDVASAGLKNELHDDGCLVLWFEMGNAHRIAWAPWANFSRFLPTEQASGMVRWARLAWWFGIPVICLRADGYWPDAFLISYHHGRLPRPSPPFLD